jgi:hypothetical protein
MKNNQVAVPDEDAAIETVLKGSGDDIAKLLSEQPSLADFVKDVQAVKEGLESIEDGEPPPFSLEKKAEKGDRRLFSRLQDLPLEWYKNPYILTFGFLLAVLFFYFCYILVSKF